MRRARFASPGWPVHRIWTLWSSVGSLVCVDAAIRGCNHANTKIAKVVQRARLILSLCGRAAGFIHMDDLAAAMLAIDHIKSLTYDDCTLFAHLEHYAMRRKKRC